MLHVGRFIVCVALLLATRADASPPPGRNWFGFNNNHNSDDPELKEWLSMIDVDPSKIISIMMKHGGLLIPESSKDELQVLAKVCKAERVRLNVMQRELEVTNFVVGLPGKEEALRIGRVYVHWDSYLKPCVEVKVDDVSVLVEFLNVLLTDTNWEELKENGFPPEFADDETAPPKKFSHKQTESPSSSFLRIGSIDLSGNIVATLKSRPLKKELARLQFSLDTFDPLDNEIKAQALENLANTGRRGCTTDELYMLIRRFMTRILKHALVDLYDDVAAGGAKITNHVGKVVTLTKKSVSDYINETGEWSGNQLHGMLSKQLTDWGLTGNYTNIK